MVANVSVNVGFGASHILFTLPTWARPSVNQIATAKVNESITHATLTPEGLVTVAAAGGMSVGDSLLVWGCWPVEP